MMVTVIVTVMLGNWQSRRAEYKLALAARYEQALREVPVDLARIGEPGPGLRYRPVQASGRFAAGAQMLLDNRIHAGRVGFDVLTPLQIAGSAEVVLVNRGWVPMGADRRSPPTPAVPSGDVTVVGRIDLPPTASARSEPEDTIWQRVDIAAMSRATGLGLLPLVIEQLEPVSPDDRLARDRIAPDFRIATHRGYMVQWYSLAALAVVLWLVLNWRGERTTGSSTDGPR
jgi:surfeit locus 1 family protein